jgi:cell division protein FtsQ
VSKVVRAERTFRARRRARRRRAIRPLLLLAVLVTLAAAGYWVALDSPALRLTTVTVKGTSRLSTADVLAAAAVPRGRSLLDVDPGAVRRRVAALRGVAQVSVDRDWPHTLVVTVVERTPAAAVRQPGGVELVDGSGVAFADVVAAPAGLLSLQVNGLIPGPGDGAAASAMRVWATLPASMRAGVTGLSARSPADVELLLTGGRRGVWGDPAQASRKLAVLASLLAKPARVYDVSTPDVPATRP